MQISHIMKEAMKTHQKKIELIQWAIISGVTTLIYSEYIRRIKQKATPVPLVLVPEIRSLTNLLDPNEHFMNLLSMQLIDQMVSVKMFQQYFDAPELELFRAENIDIMKTIFDMYIIPNISRRLPETIEIKFGLNNPKQQAIRESHEIDMFGNKPIDENHVEFMADQSVLQLLMLMPTMIKNVEIPEENEKIHMSEDEILSISHEKAICPIHFNVHIINNKTVIDLLKFVTSTQIKECDPESGIRGKKTDDSYIKYIINTGPFNSVSLTRLIGIESSAK